MIAPPVHHCRLYHAARYVWRCREEIAKWIFALFLMVFCAIGIVSCITRAFE